MGPSTANISKLATKLVSIGRIAFYYYFAYKPKKIYFFSRKCRGRSWAGLSFSLNFKLFYILTENSQLSYRSLLTQPMKKKIHGQTKPKQVSISWTFEQLDTVHDYVKSEAISGIFRLSGGKGDAIVRKLITRAGWMVHDFGGGIPETCLAGTGWSAFAGGLKCGKTLAYIKRYINDCVFTRSQTLPPTSEQVEADMKNLIYHLPLHGYHTLLLSPFTYDWTSDIGQNVLQGKSIADFTAPEPLLCMAFGNNISRIKEFWGWNPIAACSVKQGHFYWYPNRVGWLWAMSAYLTCMDFLSYQPLNRQTVVQFCINAPCWLPYCRLGQVI